MNVQEWGVMSTSKIRIKMGEIEVDYDGSEEFLKTELPALLAAVSKLYAESGRGLSVRPIDRPNAPGTNGAGSLGTTASIAASLGCKSGSDLIIAAAAQLTLVQKKDDFSRKELLEACKAGKNYWKSTYGKNMSTYLATLVGNKQLNEVSDGIYALAAAEKQTLEKKLVGG
jgi:hypothetical protein